MTILSILVVLTIYVIISLPKNMIVRAILAAAFLWFMFTFLQTVSYKPIVDYLVIGGSVLGVLYPSRKLLGALSKES